MCVTPAWAHMARLSVFVHISHKKFIFCTHKCEFSCEIKLIGTHKCCKYMHGTTKETQKEVKKEHAGIVWEGESHLTKISLFLSLCNFVLLFYDSGVIYPSEREDRQASIQRGRETPTFGTALWFSEVNLILFSLCKKAASASTSVDFYWRQKHR